MLILAGVSRALVVDFILTYEGEPDERRNGERSRRQENRALADIAAEPPMAAGGQRVTGGIKAVVTSDAARQRTSADYPGVLSLLIIVPGTLMSAAVIAFGTACC